MLKMTRIATVAIATVLVTVFVDTVLAQPVHRPNDGHNWQPGPRSGRVRGGCFGNCGRGCSNRVTACGGTHRWELVIDSAVRLDRRFIEERCIGSGIPGDTRGEVFDRSGRLYRTNGVWRYHGIYANACADHDATCRGISKKNPLYWVTCFTSTALVAYIRTRGGCAGRRSRSWGYREELFSWKFDSWRATGESCEAEAREIIP